MSAHAYLSASSAERWLNCPASARLAAKFPADSSPAASEGTIAHEIAAELIYYGTEGKDHKLADKELASDLEMLKYKADEFYAKHTETVGSYDTMKKAVEGYADFVIDEYNASALTATSPAASAPPTSS